MAEFKQGEDDDRRALIVAIELLRASIVDLKGSFLENATRMDEPTEDENKAAYDERFKKGEKLAEYMSDVDYTKPMGKGKGDDDKGGGGSIKDIITKVTAALIPISIVGGILSGFAPALQIVSTALKLLGSTILPLVMPLFVTLATILLMVSDTLWRALEPSLESFYGIIFSAVIPALNSLADAFENFIIFIDGLRDRQTGHKGRNMAGAEKVAQENADIVRKQALKEGKSEAEADALARQAKHGGNASLQDEAERLLQAGLTPEKRAERESLKGGTAKRPEGGLAAMREVFAELRSGLGQKASFGGIVEANRNLQLAALNQSPFEMKVLDRLDKMIGTMERAAENTTKPPEPRYGPASGGTGKRPSTVSQGAP